MKAHAPSGSVVSVILAVCIAASGLTASVPAYGEPTHPGVDGALVSVQLSGADGHPRTRATRRGDFAKRVSIPGGRRLFLECRGTGSPTVVLEAGTGDLARIWSLPPSGPGPAVFPAVARFTRVCAYDRPGTYLLPGWFSRSDPVAMPRSARDVVADLRKLLRAAHERGPYVLVGHSFGGMVARLDATLRPRRIAGLLSIDAQNEDFVEAYKEFLTPEQYLAAVLNPSPPPGLKNYQALERLSLETSAAEVSQAQSDTPLRRMPVVVISHSRDLPNHFGFPPEWPISELERAFQDSQDMLTGLVPGTRHLIAAKSGHYIQLDQPRLVTRAIRSLVRTERRESGRTQADSR